MAACSLECQDKLSVQEQCMAACSLECQDKLSVQEQCMAACSLECQDKLSVQEQCMATCSLVCQDKLSVQEQYMAACRLVCQDKLCVFRRVPGIVLPTWAVIALLRYTIASHKRWVQFIAYVFPSTVKCASVACKQTRTYKSETGRFLEGGDRLRHDIFSWRT